jgi:hypothetical protein
MQRSLQTWLLRCSVASIAQLLVIAGCADDDRAPARDSGAADANGGAGSGGADAGRADGGETEADAGSPVPGGICTSCGGCEQAPEVKSQFHVPGPITYPAPPPVGGDHNECWYRWGQFEDEVPDERWVHNLEHGGVVFLYDCSSGCPDELADLQALAKRNPRTILTPYAARASASSRGVVAC